MRKNDSTEPIAWRLDQLPNSFKQIKIVDLGLNIALAGETDCRKIIILCVADRAFDHA